MITREQLEEYMRDELIVREYPLNLINELAQNLANMYFEGYGDGCDYQKQLDNESLISLQKLSEMRPIGAVQ